VVGGVVVEEKWEDGENDRKKAEQKAAREYYENIQAKSDLERCCKYYLQFTFVITILRKRATLAHWRW